MRDLQTWVRRRLRWSTTRQAWTERAAALGLLLAAVLGWWVSRGWGWESRLILAMLWLAALAYCVRREIIVLLGPVFFFEIVRLSRRRVHVPRVIYASILLGTISYIYFGITLSDFRRLPDVSQQAETALIFFLTFFAVQLGIVGIIAPMMIAGTIADEKERRTLEFLMATDLRGREIVMGKLAARGAWVLLMLLAGPPVLAMLQFFGGVDPGEMLALAFASLVSLYSVACLSIMMSCLMRRGRDAILSTYLFIGFYLVLSGLARLLLFTSFTFWSLPLGAASVSGGDVVIAVGAGNPFIGAAQIADRHDSGAEYVDVLRDSLTNYVIFHLIFGTVCLGWAIYRLRPAALVQAGENRGRRRWRRRRWRPSISTTPMIWKELFVEPGPRFHLLVRLLFLLIVLLSFWPAVQIISEYWTEFFVGPYETNPWLGPDWGHRALNGWLRTMSGLIGTLMLIGVALRAAGSITGERARQTLDELLTSPLSNEAIVTAKWFGALLSPRRALLWLAACFFLCLVLSSVSVVGVLLTVAVWFAYAVFFASLGVWCSARFRTTFQATGVTILLGAFAMGGHWVLCGLGCYLPLMLSGSESRGLFDLLVPFEMGLTPPVALGTVPIRRLKDVAELAEWSDRQGMWICVGSLGPALFLIGGLILRVLAVQRFAQQTGRFAVRRPERPPARVAETPET